MGDFIGFGSENQGAGLELLHQRVEIRFYKTPAKRFISVGISASGSNWVFLLLTDSSNFSFKTRVVHMQD